MPDPTNVGPVTGGGTPPSETPPSNENERTNESAESDDNKQEFVYAHSLDPQRNVPGTSQYLDSVERRNAEVLRAKAENRKPDLENPPATQGTPVYTKDQAKQQGLDVSAPAAETYKAGTKPASLGPNFDATNGPGASTKVNQGTPIR